MAAEDGAAEIGEDISFQRLEWRIQRIGWVLMVIAIVAALLGLFGVGLLSRSNENTGLISLDYNWLLRNQSPATYRVDYQEAADEFRLQVGAGLLKSIDISRITPQPLSSELTERHLLLTFEAEESGNGSVIIDFKPKKPGILMAEFSAGSSPPLQLWQFVYP